MFDIFKLFLNWSSGLLRRLKLYRELNEDDVTVLNYFDELEIHPVHLRKWSDIHRNAITVNLMPSWLIKQSVHVEIEGDNSPFMEQTANKIIEMIGEPRNYGLFNK